MAALSALPHSKPVYIPDQDGAITTRISLPHAFLLFSRAVSAALLFKLEVFFGLKSHLKQRGNDISREITRGDNAEGGTTYGDTTELLGDTTLKGGQHGRGGTTRRGG